MAESEALVAAADDRHYAAVELADTLVELWSELPGYIQGQLNEAMTVYRGALVKHREASEQFVRSVRRNA